MSVPQLKLREEIEKRGGKVTWQGAGKPIKVEYGGKTVEISPSEYEVRWDPQEKTWRAFTTPETLAKATGTVPARATFEAKGYEVEWRPDTKQVVVRDPSTGREATLTPTALWGDRAWVEPEKIPQAEEQLKLPAERVAEEQAAEWKAFSDKAQQTLKEYSDKRMAYIDKISDAALVAYKVYQDQFAQALDLLKQQMQQSREMPLSLKIAIDELRKRVDEESKRVRDEMIRRGIAQSGIAIEEERKLRERGLTEEQKLIANWLDQEYEKATRAVFQLANLYAQSAGPMAEMYYRAATVGPQAAMELEKEMMGYGMQLAQKGYDVLSELRRWKTEQRQQAEQDWARRLQEAQKFAWEQLKWGTEQAQKEREFAWEQYKFQKQQELEREKLDYQKRRDAARAEANLRKLSPADVRNNAKADATDTIIKRLDRVYQMKDHPNFGKTLTDEIQQIEADILRTAPDLYRAGLSDSDIANLIDKAWLIGTGKTRKEIMGKSSYDYVMMLPVGGGQ